MFLSIRAVCHLAYIERSLGNRLVATHTDNNIPLYCTNTYGVIRPVLFKTGCLVAPVAVPLLPEHILRAVAKRVCIY